MTKPSFKAIGIWENERTFRHIKVQDLFGGEADRQANGDNAAGGRAGYEIEISADRLVAVLLKRAQKGGGENTLDSAPVDRQDSKTRCCHDALCWEASG